MEALKEMVVLAVQPLADKDKKILLSRERRESFVLLLEEM